MSWVYRRAGLAMLITSATTCASFVASALSSSAPDLTNFGIFTATVILIDYILVMTLLCATVVIWHNHFEMKPGLCCACCQTNGCDLLCNNPKPATTTERAQRIATGQGELIKKGRVVRFFEDVYPFAMIRRLPARAASVLCLLALVAPMIWGVTKLEPQTNSAQILPDSHPFQMFFDIYGEFPISNVDSTVTISIVWGLDEDDPLDTSGVSMLTDPDSPGQPRYNPNFDFDAAAQLKLEQACDLLMADENVVFETVDVDGVTTKNVQCWIYAFRDWRLANGRSFPATSGPTAAVLEWRASVSDSSWDEDLGYQVGAGGGVELVWTRIRADSTINERGRPSASELRLYYDAWEAVAADINANVTASLGTSVQIAAGAGSDNKWVYMIQQDSALPYPCLLSPLP